MTACCNVIAGAPSSLGPPWRSTPTTTVHSCGWAGLAGVIAAANPLRYAGYDYDTWSGDYYLQARYYDPVTKQFLSADPDEENGEESAYQYCSGDPIQAADPTGTWGWFGLSRAYKHRATAVR